MAGPRGATVTFSGESFDAFAVEIALKRPPQAGRPRQGTSVKVDTDLGQTYYRPAHNNFLIYANAHDSENLPSRTLQKIVEAFIKGEIGPSKIELWKDEKQEDALITFSFNAYVGEYRLFGNVGAKESKADRRLAQKENVVFRLRLDPVVDQAEGIKVVPGN